MANYSELKHKRICEEKTEVKFIVTNHFILLFRQAILFYFFGMYLVSDFYCNNTQYVD